MNAARPFTVRDFNAAGQNTATKYCTSVTAAEEAVLSLLVPSHIRAEIRAFAAMKLEIATRDTTRPSAFMLPDMQTGHVVVEYQHHEIGRFTVADVPPFVGALPDELIAHRLRVGADAVKDRPPMPRGKHQRAVVRLLTEELENEAVAVVLYNKLRPFLK